MWPQSFQTYGPITRLCQPYRGFECPIAAGGRPWKGTRLETHSSLSSQTQSCAQRQPGQPAPKPETAKGRRREQNLACPTKPMNPISPTKPDPINPINPTKPYKPYKPYKPPKTPHSQPPGALREPPTSSGPRTSTRRARPRVQVLIGFLLGLGFRI